MDDIICSQNDIICSQKNSEIIVIKSQSETTLTQETLSLTLNKHSQNTDDSVEIIDEAEANNDSCTGYEVKVKIEPMD